MGRTGQFVRQHTFSIEETFQRVYVSDKMPDPACTEETISNPSAYRLLNTLTKRISLSSDFLSDTSPIKSLNTDRPAGFNVITTSESAKWDQRLQVRKESSP
jgi:hypothetical protein